MWEMYDVPFWRQVLAWWRGEPGEPVVMRRRVGGVWQYRPLTAAEHQERREAEAW